MWRCGNIRAYTQLAAGGPTLVAIPVVPLDHPNMPIDGIRVAGIHLGYTGICITLCNNIHADVYKQSFTHILLVRRPSGIQPSGEYSSRRRSVYLRIGRALLTDPSPRSVSLTLSMSLSLSGTLLYEAKTTGPRTAVSTCGSVANSVCGATVLICGVVPCATINEQTAMCVYCCSYAWCTRTDSECTDGECCMLGRV